ncbi:MAG TPA: nuclear transport factor 2 family protein [Acidobacteriota bacterium]|nr:nuclear transport factor 2 family protein [Acidobacteriota bacterium]
MGLTGLVLLALGGPQGGEEIIERYRQAVNAHDMDRALACLAPDFQLHFVGSEYSLSKEALSKAMGWDAGADGQVEWEPVGSSGGSFSYEGQESNEFLRLLGIPHLKFQTTFSVNSQGLIEKQRYQLLPDQPSSQEAMKPAVEWARRHRPQELAEIYPDGQMVYSKEMARRWVALLKEWRAATSP